jgi:hypothetical protein
VLLILWTNKQPSEPKHTNTQRKLARLATYATPVRPMACAGQTSDTGQTGGQSRSDRWTEPVRTVAAATAQQVFKRASVTSLGPGIKIPQKHNLQGRRTLHKTKQNNSKQTKNWPATTQPKNTRD